MSSDRIASYVYTDRPVYRPEQKVYFKGIVRRLGEGGYETPAARAASVKITDQNNNEIFNKELPLSSRGTFSGEVDLSAGASLGYYSIVASFDDAQTRGSFEVAEYKKPEFKVKVTTPKNFVPVGEKTKFTIEAKYFFGAPVTSGDVKYYIYRSRYYHWWFRDEYDDGIGGSEDEEDDEEGYHGYGNDMVKEGEGRLDAQGRLEVTFDVPPLDENQPYDFTYRLEAQVTDPSRREEEGKASFIGTRGNVVVFAHPERYVYYQNDSARIKIKTADYEGRPVSSKVGLNFVEVKYEKVEKREGDYTDVTYKPVYRDLSSAEVTTNSQGEATYDYRIPITGSIRIKTSVDDKGKRIPSDAGYIYAADRNNRWADWAYQDYSSIKLIPDKKSYQPGETAHVLAMLPADKAHLLVTTEMSSVMSHWRVDAASRAVMIDVKIEERFVPNVYLSVAYVKDGEMFESNKSINVPARSKFLNLEIIPDKKEYKPRDPASYTIVARNADGTPAAGVELSLGVVDEAIYSVRPDTTGDIRRTFYGTRYNRVETAFLDRLQLHRLLRQQADGACREQTFVPTGRFQERGTTRRAEGSQGFQRHGVLEARCGDRRGRQGDSEIRSARKPDDVARHGSRGDRRSARRLDRQPRPLAQGFDTATRNSALHDRGRHRHGFRHRSQLSRIRQGRADQVGSHRREPARHGAADRDHLERGRAAH